MSLVVILYICVTKYNNYLQRRGRDGVSSNSSRSGHVWNTVLPYLCKVIIGLTTFIFRIKKILTCYWEYLLKESVSTKLTIDFRLAPFFLGVKSKIFLSKINR